MVYFTTKNPYLGKFGRVLQWKMLVYFMDIRPILQPIGIFLEIPDILWTFGIFCDNLVYFSPFWHVVPRKIWQP
jgi:hypothetical protein